MVVGLLKKIFGADDADSTQGSGADRPAPGQPDVEAFVTYVVRCLVDSPEDVKVEAADSESTIALKVACAKEDIGKVIGRKGQTIAAVRALANGAAGRMGKKVNIEVLD